MKTEHVALLVGVALVAFAGYYVISNFNSYAKQSAGKSVDQQMKELQGD